MTEEILAVIPPRRGDRVAVAARALEPVLGLPVEYRTVPVQVDRVTGALADPDVAYGVLPYEAGRVTHVIDQVIQQVEQPVIVVPCGAPAGRDVVSRILVPLDGTREAADAMRTTLRSFAGSGIDVVALHVVDPATAPRFWDQPAHARSSWEHEFRARYCNVPDVRVELRVGTPGERIVDVATTEDVDLIALGWAQHFAGRHAAAVRSVLRQAQVPVLLIPTHRQRAAGGSGAGSAPGAATAG